MTPGYEISLGGEYCWLVWLPTALTGVDEDFAGEVDFTGAAEGLLPIEPNTVAYSYTVVVDETHIES